MPTANHAGSYGPGVPNTPLAGKNNEQLVIRSGLHTRPGAPAIAQQQIALLSNNNNFFEPLQLCDQICLTPSKIVKLAANGICGEELDCPAICSEQKGSKSLRRRRSSAKVKKCGQQLDKNANRCINECG